MNNTVVTGIVISSMPIGEYDRRLEILTNELGRISAFARGARKPSSPLVACSRAFAFGKFTLFQGRNSYSLNSAVISDFFVELSEDFELNCFGSYFLELAKYFSEENLEADEMITLLYYSLKALISPKFSNRLVKAIYEIKIIEINGIYKKPQKKFSEGCAYAMDFVVRSPAEKIYSFKLSDDVQKEFEAAAQSLIDKTADRKFKSLAMLDEI